jgi:hypothetical protein
MATVVTLAPVRPRGEPFCARPEGDWVWHWTIAACIHNFEHVPRLFLLLGVTTKVAAAWDHLTVEMQGKLDAEFVSYDIRTCRI